MKKLNKLQINSEKLLKNEELLVFRGGYGDKMPCWWGTNGGPAFQLRCSDCSFGYITPTTQDYCSN